jgi:hypothetical protein
MQSSDDPYDWSEGRGHVVSTITCQQARDHIDVLSHKYVGRDYAMPIGPAGRTIYVIQPDKVNTPKSVGSG